MAGQLWVRRMTSAVMCVWALAFSATAAAQTAPDELARRHFESGAAYLEQSEYESALREFEKAHELSRRPEILINIATVHERLGNLDEAVTALEGYLSAAPEGDHAETIRIRLENLKERRDEQAAREAPSPSPEPTADPPSVPAPAPAPAVAPAPAAPAPEPDTGPSRVPAYVLLGVAGVTTAGAVLTGVLAKGEYDDAENRCAPHCSDDDLSTGRTLALTSTILTGAAVVSAAVGAVLFFGAESGDTRARSAGPRLTAFAGKRGAMAEARWTF